MTFSAAAVPGPVITYPNVSAGHPGSVWVPAHIAHHQGLPVVALVVLVLVVVNVVGFGVAWGARHRGDRRRLVALGAASAGVVVAVAGGVWPYTTSQTLTTHHDASADMGMGGSYSDAGGGVFVSRGEAVAYARQVRVAGAGAVRRAWRGSDGGVLACWSLCGGGEAVAYPVGDSRGVRVAGRVDEGVRDRLVMGAVRSSYGLTPVNAGAVAVLTDDVSPSVREVDAGTQYVDGGGHLERCVVRLGDRVVNGAGEVVSERVVDVACVSVPASSVRHVSPVG